MSVFHNNALIGASGQAAGGAYEIERSLRFNSSDSAYLGATFSTPTDQDVFTLSMWVKRSALGSTQHLFGVSTNHSFGFTSGDALDLTFGGSSALTTTALFRDPSAWYHIVWTQNGTSHTIYVNNVSVGTATATSSVFNTAVAHQLGAGNTTNFFNGYLADIHFIDGQALTPSSFTEVDATTGQLVPIAYSGTYGTNGFHLPFSDNSTAAALGTDTSGNSNTWTVNNISVTAGAGNDSLVDSPTNYGTDTGAGGEVRGNYCTWNPLCRSSAYATISNGNLDLAVTTNDYGYSGTLFVPNSGKWYFEITLSATSGNGPAIGIVSAKAEASDMYDSSYASGLEYGGPVYAYNPGQGTKMSQSASTSYVTASSPSANDVFMIAVDFDNGAIYFGKNGTWLNSGVPTSGASKTGAAFTSIDAESYAPVIHAWGTGITGVLNAGQRPFAYTAPSGFKALCTTNLDAPLVAKPSEVMDVALYTGNGGTQTISGLGFSPDLVWIKNRTDNSTEHVLQDALRGFTTGAKLSSSSTEDEGDTTVLNDSFGYVDSATSDGFTLTKSGTGAADYSQTNQSTKAYVAWTWDAGSSTVTNNDGSIESQVRANPSAGFSVVTYTPTSNWTSNANATVGHGLGVKPALIIAKNRDRSVYWSVYHSSLGAADWLRLNTTDAAVTTTVWGNPAVEPTSTVFTFGDDNSVGNIANEKIVAYCFAPVAGYSAFGSYTGNGSADGPFVYTGFRPKYLLVKSSSNAVGWYVLDSVRNDYNTVSRFLIPNASDAEVDGGAGSYVDFLSNGFKWRASNTAFNASSYTYVWAAFAEHPFQTARAR